MELSVLVKMGQMGDLNLWFLSDLQLNKELSECERADSGQDHLIAIS